MDHSDIRRAALASKLAAEKIHVPGGILDGAGNLVAVAGQYELQDDEPREDETVYTVSAAYQGPQNLRLEPQFPAGYVMLTFQIAGGSPHDNALLLVKGAVSPPEGTRLAVRLLKPAPKPVDESANGSVSEQR